MEVKESSKEILADGLVFKGDQFNPFLAPRGVWLTNDRLFVSDTGQNRVFIWNQCPKEEYASPDVVLGQSEAKATGRNSGSEVSAKTLQYPSGIWSDGEILIVADAWNHRVLIWNKIPSTHGQAADVVLGQPDFASSEPNVKGLGTAPSANSLYWPYGVFSNGRELWIADTGNRRVLYFDKIPTESFVPASKVIGKENFNERDYENEDPVWPYSVRVNGNGEMAITDTQYYRVLIWKDYKTSFHSKADRIIGQADFQSNGQNQFRLSPAAHTLNWCYDSFFDNDHIWVVDTGNSRLLKFPAFPFKNNQSAIDIIGHPDYNTGSENIETIMGTENALYWPFSLCIAGEYMAIADTGNHRIIIGRKK